MQKTSALPSVPGTFVLFVYSSYLSLLILLQAREQSSHTFHCNSFSFIILTFRLLIVFWLPDKHTTSTSWFPTVMSIVLYSWSLEFMHFITVISVKEETKVSWKPFQILSLEIILEFYLQKSLIISDTSIIFRQWSGYRSHRDYIYNPLGYIRKSKSEYCLCWGLKKWENNVTL